MTIEEHPLSPFLPPNGKLLFLGSFPPPKARWCMDWFYPNWINDFWRIQGLIHFGNKQYFEKEATTKCFEKEATIKCFNKERIVAFCEAKGMAFFDTARKVCRLKENASDDHLEIIEGTDILALLAEMPNCHTIITTGGKASEELCHYFEQRGISLTVPKIGESTTIATDRPLTWWRMPSSSRAYPLKLEKKAAFYQRLFE